MARTSDVGDGDLCPEQAEHGRMLTVKGHSNRQWCPSQEHDGRPKTHPEGPTEQSRAFFPLYMTSDWKPSKRDAAQMAAYQAAELAGREG